MEGVGRLVALDCGRVGVKVDIDESSTVQPFKATIFGFVNGDGGTDVLGFGIWEHAWIG
jgi:hypothetical protein